MSSGLCLRPTAKSDALTCLQRTYNNPDSTETNPIKAAAAAIGFELPKKATTNLVADVHLAACPLYPRKRTCAVQLGMSALCQKRTLIAWLQRYPFGHSHQLRHVLHPQFFHHTAAVQLDRFHTNSEDECGLFV